MRLRVLCAALIALAVVSTSCSENDIVGPTPPDKARIDVAAASLPAVRISEFHYDNFGTDSAEKVEISGPAGTNLSGYSLVLYNGNTATRAPYTTTPLSGTIPATCGARGVVVIAYPSNGIQNGSSTATGIDPDGFALVNGTTVLEFLSYEGSFVALSGPAAGMTSTDIGIREIGESHPPIQSLKRDYLGVWSGPSVNNFGVCNDQAPGEVEHVTLTPSSASIVEGGTQQFTATATDGSNNPVPSVAFTWATTDATVASVDNAGLATGVNAGDAKIIATAPNGVADTSDIHVDEPPPDVSGPVFISEIHYDNDGVDANEAIEIEGPAGANLAGWSIVLYNGNGGASYATLPLTGLIPTQCTARGTVVVPGPAGGIQNGSPDGLALVKPDGSVVEFLSYEGGMTATNGPALGMAATDIGVDESSTASPTRSLMRYDGSWYGPQPSTFGSCNPPPPPPTIQFTGRTPFDPPLPVGFQDQLFASLTDASGHQIPTTFTWTSETPGVASIDANGVITALSAGSAIFRATATSNGTTQTYTLPTRIAVASTTAVYAGNAEFGEPTDSDPSDDYIIRRDQYTTSYNKNRGTPNWVSYDLEQTHFGPEDRCDCFTFDPLLPAAFTHYTTADYTGAGTFHGYGIDRGHFARSFDRTSASLDNATTYYFSNIVPQASAVNQGPWAIMENELGDKARLVSQNKEVYIIAGVAGSKGTLKNEGKIVIPTHVWKVALIMPRDKGLADIHSLADIDEVIAVIMPNDPVINSDWKTYKTTVDAVEALSGYDLLALLPDPIEIAVESNTKPPTAATSGPYSSSEGDAVALSGAGSTDPDGDALTYDWDFGDTSTGTGVAPSHTYSQDGSYTVRLIVTDIRGLADTITTTANVSNVAPSIGAFAGATLLPGETYNASGSFTDPGADSWSATVDYGAGAGANPLSLSGKSFTLSNTYNSAGVFTVTVRVSDDDVTSTATQTVTVLSVVQAIDNATALVNDLTTGGVLNSGNANSLLSKLDAAKKAIQRGQTSLAAAQLNSLLNQINSLVSEGQLTAAQANDLRILVNRIIESIT